MEWNERKGRKPKQVPQIEGQISLEDVLAEQVEVEGGVEMAVVERPEVSDLESAKERGGNFIELTNKMARLKRLGGLYVHEDGGNLGRYYGEWKGIKVDADQNAMKMMEVLRKDMRDMIGLECARCAWRAWCLEQGYSEERLLSELDKTEKESSSRKYFRRHMEEIGMVDKYGEARDIDCFSAMSGTVTETKKKGLWIPAE